VRGQPEGGDGGASHGGHGEQKAGETANGKRRAATDEHRWTQIRLTETAGSREGAEDDKDGGADEDNQNGKDDEDGKDDPLRGRETRVLVLS